MNKTYIALGFGATILLTVFAAFSWYNKAINTPVDANSPQDIVIEIKSGSSASTISKVLLENGLIKSELAFKIYAKQNSSDFAAVKAGYFKLNKSQNVPELVAALQNPIPYDPTDIRITIKEGLRIDEVAEALAKGMADNAKFSKDEFIDITETFTAADKSKLSSKAQAYVDSLGSQITSLEGMLFPETYFFAKDADAANVASRMVETMDDKTKNITITNGLTKYENLILASIVEREAFPPDHEGVAGVFLNRIEQDMMLGSDITVLYPLKRWSPEPTAKELQLDSPYNTRKFNGLPPTPVCNPSFSAVSKTATAPISDYVFFIADKDGIIRYAKTFAEHEANVRKYL